MTQAELFFDVPQAQIDRWQAEADERAKWSKSPSAKQEPCDIGLFDRSITEQTDIEYWIEIAKQKESDNAEK